VDKSRTQIEERYEDLMAQAQARRSYSYTFNIQWDITGAITLTLVASDAVWNAVPGNITNLTAVL
jgi:hypothetical protein